ncbi:hypothetical protein RN001_005624 [Aquatica leii]|uniref:BESS domain-containing protein n=1 Tax=Aquatica leii TaxID=1421715 RepID=A0AAN7Q811_9COLE|nr:hypothetical protein RN001_005624 [Aquatica leii]
MAERNTWINAKKQSMNIPKTHTNSITNISSRSERKTYLLNEDGSLVSEEGAEEHEQHTNEYDPQIHMDDTTYSPSASDAPSTPEGPTNSTLKKSKRKLNPADKRFLSFFEKRETSSKRNKSSNELFLASLLEDTNKLNASDLSKFKITILSKLSELLEK